MMAKSTASTTSSRQLRRSAAVKLIGSTMPRSRLLDSSSTLVQAIEELRFDQGHRGGSPVPRASGKMQPWALRFCVEVEAEPRKVLGQFRTGIELEEGLTAPADARLLKQSAKTALVEVVLHEGRKRQVRRMLNPPRQRAGARAASPPLKRLMI